MASTAQVWLPYSGVEKERRCGVALSGLSLGATGNAWTTRETLWRAFLKFGANLLRAFDPIERCRADQRFCERSPASFVFERLTMLDVIWRGKMEDWRALSRRSFLARLFALRLGVQRYLFCETLALGQPFSQSLDKPLVAFSAFGLRAGERGVRYR
jgi:hypothetical protein